MQGQAQAAQLQKEVQHLRSEIDRLRNELSQERNDKGQRASRVAALEQQLQQKTSSLVHALHLLWGFLLVLPAHGYTTYIVFLRIIAH